MRIFHPKRNDKYISNIQNIDKDNHAVLQIIDTGGQPEFHEMLPALITGPAVNLLVFKLTEDLQGRYPITYRSSDGSSDPYLTSLTHEEVIFRSLSSIACLRYNTVGWRFDHDEVPVKDDSEPAAFLIATHRDCVDDDKVDTVNDHLKHRILQSSAELFGKKLFQFSAPGKPVFALDTTRDQNEIEYLRKSLHNVINTKFEDIKVPVSLCALSLKLKRQKQSLHTYQTCFKLAKQSGIKDKDDFKAVLWFLHNRAGTIMYYPDVEGLEDIIITNIQLVFDRITELMTSCFTFKNLGVSTEEEFDTMGMFKEYDITELSKHKGDCNETLGQSSSQVNPVLIIDEQKTATIACGNERSTVDNASIIPACSNNISEPSHSSHVVEITQITSDVEKVDQPTSEPLITTKQRVVSVDWLMSGNKSVCKQITQSIKNYTKQKATERSRIVESQPVDVGIKKLKVSIHNMFTLVCILTLSIELCAKICLVTVFHVCTWKSVLHLSTVSMY